MRVKYNKGRANSGEFGAFTIVKSGTGRFESSSEFHNFESLNFQPLVVCRELKTRLATSCKPPKDLSSNQTAGSCEGEA